MIKFRFHRGSLASAMETMVEVKDKNELLAHIVQNCMCVYGPIGIDRPYGDGRDDRIAWKETYYVCDQRGVIGMIDTLIEELENAHKR